MKINSFILAVCCILVLFPSCKIEKNDKYSEETLNAIQNSQEKDANTLADEEIRGDWQKPNLVVSKFGNLSGKTVADIGAGSGYFMTYLVQKAKKVIAVDIDEQAIKILEIVKNAYSKETQEKIDIRLVDPNDPKLARNEVDAILIVNTIAFIENRSQYLDNLRSSLKLNGTLLIVDFKMKMLDIDAPPADQRLSLLSLQESLIEAGFEIVETDDTSLEYQYIITAKDSNPPNF